MKKLTAEKIDNIMGAMSCIVTGFCLMALIMMGHCCFSDIPITNSYINYCPSYHFGWRAVVFL